MSITIKTKKAVNSNGELGRRIIEVNLLDRDQLPQTYRDDANSVYKSKKKPYSIITFHEYPARYQDHTLLKEGDFISEDSFQKNLAIIRTGGNLLHEVNTKLKALRKAWSGEETFEI